MKSGTLCRFSSDGPPLLAFCSSGCRFCDILKGKKMERKFAATRIQRTQNFTRINFRELAQRTRRRDTVDFSEALAAAPVAALGLLKPQRECLKEHTDFPVSPLDGLLFVRAFVRTSDHCLVGSLERWCAPLETPNCGRMEYLHLGTSLIFY